MNSIKEFFKNKKRIVIVSAAAVAIIVFVVCLIVGCSGNEDPRKNPVDNSTAVTTEATTADLATTDVENEATVTDEMTDTEKATEESETESSEKSDETKEPETTKAPETTACVHDYKKSETAPTCTNNGYIVFTCSKCGNSYTEAGKNATGHNWVAGQVVAPTETAQGYTVYTCSVCGSVIWDNYTPATGVTTTATQQGTTSGKETISGGNSSCNHNWVRNDDWCIAPTEQSNGQDEFDCSICGAMKLVPVPKLVWNGCNHAQHCTSNAMHEAVTKVLAEGCPYCGRKDCPYVNSIDNGGGGDRTTCCEYDPHNDPSVYCQVCGLPRGAGQGKCIGASWFMSDCYCPYCGQWIGNGNCHHCTTPLGNQFSEDYRYCQQCGKLYTNGYINHVNSGECTG